MSTHRRSFSGNALFVILLSTRQLVRWLGPDAAVGLSHVF